jgi:hypothetical protein
MMPPGAATLGLIESSFVGPHEVNVDKKPPVILFLTNSPVARRENEIVVFGLDLSCCPSLKLTIAPFH